MLFYLIPLFIGILAGTITGLIPGIHVNLLTILLLSISATLLTLTTPINLIIFIVAMSITHTFIDYIPSIFLGAPDEDTALSILPGHKLLLKGFGYIAIVLTLYGSLTALLIILILTPIFIYALPIFYPYIQRIMWIILILISFYLIFNEKEKQKRIWAAIIFFLAGFLGIASLNLNINEPLLPLLTGLFGASNLIISINQKIKLPPQKIYPIRQIRLSKKSFFKSSFASIISAPFTAFLPGLGASQAAIIGNEITELNQKEFLFLMGAINTIVMGLSIITYYSINKTRTGAAVAISKLLETLSLNHLLLIISTIIISGIVATFITINISKVIAKYIHKFNYSYISISILSFLTILIIYFSGIIGLIIFITGAALGIATIILGIRRMHLMGCLLIPTILFYLI